MQLLPDWKQIVKKAKSFRLNALSVAFSCAELLLPIFETSFPRGLFAILSCVAALGAMYFRIHKQKGY